jgi:hypothetical protein
MAIFSEFPPEPRQGLVDQFGNLLASNPPNQPMDLPFQDTFSAIIQGISPSFIRELWDEALRHSRENSLAMRRDCSIMGWLREWKEGILSRKWHLEIDDENNPVQIAVRDGMTKIIRAIPHLKRIFRWLLEARWYGRYGVQLLWKEVYMELPAVPTPGLFPFGNDREQILQRHLSGGGQLQKGPDGNTAEPKAQSERRKVTTVVKSAPVNGDKLNFLFSGTPLVAIYAGFEGNTGDDGYEAKRLRDQGADVRKASEVKTQITWDNLSPLLVLTPGEWRERFIIHKHDPDDADYFQAEQAGAVHGVGIRSRCYWWWWQRQNWAAAISDITDRMGLGFIVIKFEAGNIKAEAAAHLIAKKWNRRSVLAVPVSPDQIRGGGGIEVVDVPTAGILVMQSLIEEANRHMERFVVGQSMSSGEMHRGENGGKGTVGPARMAEETKFQLLMAGGEELEETLTGSEEEPGLCSTIQKYTYPGTIDRFRVRFRFMVDDPDAQPKIDAIVALASAGVEFGQDSARKLTGEPAPKEGEKTFGGKTPAPAIPGAIPGQPGAIPGQNEEGEDDGSESPEPGMNGNGKAPPFADGKAEQ